MLADASFAGRLVDWATRILKTTLHIVRKPAGQAGFTVHPDDGWSNEPCAWLTNHRRVARDYERDRAMSESMIRWAAVIQMIRRLARGRPTTRQQRQRYSDTPA